jgi:hypothetical protein
LERVRLKLGWRDFAMPRLAKAKSEAGITERDDIMMVPDMIDFEEGRTGEKSP